MKRKIELSNPWTMESWMIRKAPAGEVFFTLKPDREMTALAGAYGRKIRTTRAMVITGNMTSPQVRTATQVTLLDDPAEAGMAISTI